MDFSEVAKDGSSFARANLMANATEITYFVMEATNVVSFFTKNYGIWLDKCEKKGYFIKRNIYDLKGGSYEAY